MPPCKNGNKARLSPSPTPTYCCTGSLPSAKGQKNDTKGIKIGKEEIKTSLLTDDILIII